MRQPISVAKHVGDTMHVDRDSLAQMLGYSARTIRAYCKPVRYDPDTRRALYDAVAVDNYMKQRGYQPRPEKQGVARPRRPIGAPRRPHRRTAP